MADALQSSTPPGAPLAALKRNSLKDTDARLESETPRQFPADREIAVTELRQKLPGVDIDFDPITGGPKHIMAVGKFLSPAVADPSGGRYTAVLKFIESARGLFGHDPTALTPGKSRVMREDTSAHNGMKTVVWQQELDGIPFFQTILRANLTKNGELITMGGNYLSDPDAATGHDAVKRAALIANPTVPANRAVILAAENIGTHLEENSISRSGGSQGTEKKQQFQADSISDTSASLTWVPLSNETAKLAWDVTIMSNARGEMFRVLVDAENGGVLVRHSLTNYISDATFRVHASNATKQPRDSPTPMSPGHATPLTAQPAAVSSELVTLDALSVIASPAGWINDGDTQTLGNNVEAHTDTDANNSPDLPRPTSATRNFDFPINFGNAPDTYKDAAVTNLFYLNNWVHDKLYGLGFTETSGNFQTNNFGRGGNGNDAVQADAQDGSGTNNANFSTPSDGSPGRMQMYVFTGPTPDIDGDLDSEIVIHEYVHGLSNRLVGGGVGISASQTQGMGEGWSDFYALSLLSESGDDIHGNYAAGGYATRQFSGLSQNYYFGIRRYPYSTNLTKNPLTFKDIDPAQAAIHAGVPRSPIIGNTANDVHNTGEVWCSALWEMRANLITKHGFTTGNPLALQLVTDAMKLCPANPNFLQSRDAILQADLVNNSGANISELWDAFAKRGMGTGAVSPSSSSTTGLVEAYDIPDDLGVSPLGAFAASGQTGGGFSPTSQSYTLHNSGISSLNWSAAKTQPWLALSAAGGSLAPGAMATVTVSWNASTASLTPGNYTDAVTFSNLTSGTSQQRSVNLTIEPQYVTIFSDTFESGTLASPWTITGTGTHRTLVATANAPHAGTRHLTMDSSVDSSYARNEATLTLDLAGRSKVVLSFWVKMFSDEPDAPATNPFTGGADFDGVAISGNDGGTWHEIRDLRAISNTWQKITVDLDAAVASSGLAYSSNFKIRFNHYDNYTISTDGFAFDDILLAQTFTNTLTLAAPDSATEGDAPVTATVFANPSPSEDLLISLTSGNTQVSVPATITIPAGASSVNFQITPDDDTLLDGSQNSTLTATAGTYATASKSFTVHDNETVALAIEVPDSAIEGSSPPTGIVSVSVPVDAAVMVALASDNPSVQLPPGVTIQAGASTAQFPINLTDDDRINGSRPALITASVTGWTAAGDTITILDNEPSILTVTLPSLREGDTGKSGTARISGTLATDLQVYLASNDLSELTVPDTVTIPAGHTSVPIPLTIINDSATDGTQPVMMLADANGFPHTTANGSVADNDVHHFDISSIANTVLRNSPVTVQVTARDVNGLLITNYAEVVIFTAKDDSEAAVPLTPGASGAFVNGVLSAQITFTGYAAGVLFSATNTTGHLGTSNSFDVVCGPLDHFAWSHIASPQHVDAPFPASLRALDTVGNTVTEFTGQAALSAIPSGKVSILSWTAFADTAGNGEYANAKQAVSAHFTNFEETATTVTNPAELADALVGKNVFLIVEQESSSEPELASIGTSWAGVLGNFVNGGGVVIACSNTTAEHLLLANSGLLDTTVNSSPTSATITKPADTPLNAGVAVPFTGSYLHTYTTTNGTVDLLASGTQPVVISRSIGAGRVILIGTDYFTTGTEMDKVIANAVSLAQPPVGSSLPVSPANTENFVAGEWSGNISVPFLTPDMALRASVGADSADSNRFSVETVQPPPNRTAVLTEDFESGSLNPSRWGVSGTGSFSTQVSSNYSPHGGSKHMTMDSLSGFARNEATLTLDLAGRSGVVMDFWASGYTDEPNGPPPAPFFGGANFDGVAISADGNTWWEVQGLRSLPSNYGMFTVDLDAAIAAHGLSYNAAFKIRFNQYDDFPLTTDGIVIDDISITADAPQSELAFLLPPEVAEGTGTASGVLELADPSTEDLTIQLSSTSPAKMSVPASVMIPEGQTSVSFPITIEDDPFVDGEKTVFLVASAVGHGEVWEGIRVMDNDGGEIHLNFAGSPSENSGQTTGTATLSVPALAALTAQLSSDDSQVAQPQASISFPRGATSVDFQVTIPDDNIVDGEQTAHLTATIPGWTTGTGDLVVHDDESRNLVLTIPPDFRETDSLKLGTVSLGGTAADDLVISLSSSDSSEITVPETVTILSGQSSVIFAITTQDDLIADGSQPFTITASAATFTDGTASGLVRDNEAHHFSFATIGSPQVKNGPVPAIVSARDSLGAVMKDYNSDINLSAVGDSEILAVTPSAGSGFINGVWSGSVQIDALDTHIVLTADDGLGNSGSSNPFDLVDGQMDHFIWDTIPSPQTVDTPFNVTVRAVDSNGDTVTAYNGIASLFALASTRNSTVGNGDATSALPIYTYSHDSRSVAIYKAGELGGSARLTALSLNVTSVPQAAESLANWKIRLKHTNLTALAPGSSWDNTGWTTVYQASPVISATGWVTFTFTTPFDFNGTDNLLVDFSMDRAGTNYSNILVQASNTSGTGMIYGVSDSVHGDPSGWSDNTPYTNGINLRPDVCFSSMKEIPIRPSPSGSFTNGIWSGEVSVPVSGNVAGLKAQAGAVTGTSNPFQVNPSPTTSPQSSTVFSENYESGVLNPAYWTSTGTGNFRTQVTSSFSPHGGARHMTMDSIADYARNEATLTLDLSGRSGVVLKFWAAGYNDEPSGPPPSPFTGGSDFDGVAISADGTSWWEVRSLRSLPATYGMFTVDLDAAIAAHGINYNSTFKIRFNQYDDFPLTTDGIVIDDILVTAESLSGFAFNTPTQVTEGDGIVAAGVTLDAVAATDTIIALTSSAPAKIAVPSSVTVPAGQTGAPFGLTVQDDAIADGNRSVTISGTIAGQFPNTSLVTVTDDDTLPLTLSAPSSVTEGIGIQTATLTLGAPPSSELMVILASSDNSELTIPASIVFQPGQTTATFPVTVVNDAQIDGTQLVSLSASISGWSTASMVVQVMDNETRLLTLTGPYSAYEGYPSSGTVGISGTLPNDLQVALVSSDPSQFSVPANVTIPAGSTSVSFVATAVDDTVTDGSQEVTITASAATFQNASVNSSAYDNDVHHFNISAIPANVTRGVPVGVIVSAVDINNTTISVANGSFSLTANSGGNPISMTPATSLSFSNGHWNGNLTFTSPGSGVTVTATDTAGHSGVSNSFNVLVGDLTTLVWDPVPSNVEARASFSATIIARDANSHIDTKFNGTAALTAGPAQRTVGTGVLEDDRILSTATTESRSQCIYLASQLGGAGKLTGLALDIARIPNITLTRFTIRIRPTILQAYPVTRNWESSGWTTVYQSDLAISRTGWLFLPFSSPYLHHGTDNLIIDFSFDNAGTGISGIVKSANTFQPRTYFYHSPGTYGDPLTWSGTSPTGSVSTFLPNLRLRVERNIQVNPASVTFTDGVWSGNASVEGTGSALTLTADADTGTTGESNIFTSSSIAAMAVSPPEPFTATGPRGGPFTPLSRVFTISNAGYGTMPWTATPDVPWIEVSAGSGNLSPGGSTTVTATLNPSLLGALSSGNHQGTLEFVNPLNNLGNTTIPFEITVTPAAEMSVTPLSDFTPNGPSGGPFTPADRTYTLTNIGDAPMAWTVAKSAPWLDISETSGTLAPGASASIHLTLGAALLEPGIHTDTLTFSNTTNGKGNTTRGVSLEVLQPAPVLTPEPSFTAGLANTIFWSNTTGAHFHEVQSSTHADFSNATGSGWMVGTNHTFTGLADATLYHYRVRSRRTQPAQTDVWLQTSQEELDLGTKNNTIVRPSGDVVLTNTGGYAASGTITSPAISPPQRHAWGVLGFGGNTEADGTGMTVDVLDAGGNLLAASVAAGTDLSGIPAVSNRTSIRLRANLTTANPANTPLLDDWSVTYTIAPEQDLTSSWSDPVSSTQDASPPSLMRTTPLTSTNAIITIQGGAADAASGVGGVIANGHPASTTDDFATWTSPSVFLVPGDNLISVTASDAVTPANSHTEIWTITYAGSPTADTDGDKLPDDWEIAHGLDPTEIGTYGDPDTDGISNLLEYALGLDPSVADHTGLPTAELRIKQEDGLNYLTFQYRRRIAHGGLQYLVETNTALDTSSWGENPADLEEISTTPTGDGVTELLTVRTKPSADVAPGKFVRLRVLAD